MIGKKKFFVATILAAVYLGSATLPAPFLPCLSTACASPLQEIDGIHFWHGNRNYPVWDTGNRFCSALDLSSAYVVSNDDTELMIAVTTVTFSYGEDEAVATSRDTFKENKQSGQAYLCNEERGTCQSIGSKKWLNDVYYYLKCYLQLL